MNIKLWQTQTIIINHINKWQKQNRTEIILFVCSMTIEMVCFFFFPHLHRLRIEFLTTSWLFKNIRIHVISLWSRLSSFLPRQNIYIEMMLTWCNKQFCIARCSTSLTLRQSTVYIIFQTNKFSRTHEIHTTHTYG